MPYLDLPGNGVSMYYLINPRMEKPYGGTSEPECRPFDPSKPNLIFLHSAMTCSTVFYPQYQDPRLQEAFNLVAFDSPLHGRTKGPEVGKWTARDSFECLLLALDLLPEISTYSIVGEAGQGTFLATLLAAKRSEQVESLVLVSVGNFAELENRLSWRDWAENAVSNKGDNGDGTGRIPDDEVKALDTLLFGKSERNQIHRELLLANVQARYGTGQSSHDLGHIGRLGTHNDSITEEEYLAVTAPVLILQGDRQGIASNLASASHAAAAFRNAPSEPDVQIILGGRYLILFSDYSVSNRIILKFVTRNRQMRRPSETSMKSTDTTES